MRSGGETYLVDIPIHLVRDLVALFGPAEESVRLRSFSVLELRVGGAAVEAWRPFPADYAAIQPTEQRPAGDGASATGLSVERGSATISRTGLTRSLAAALECFSPRTWLPPAAQEGDARSRIRQQEGSPRSSLAGCLPSLSGKAASRTLTSSPSRITLRTCSDTKSITLSTTGVKISLTSSLQSMGKLYCVVLLPDCR